MRNPAISTLLVNTLESIALEHKTITYKKLLASISRCNKLIDYDELFSILDELTTTYYQLHHCIIIVFAVRNTGDRIPDDRFRTIIHKYAYAGGSYKEVCRQERQRARAHIYTLRHPPKHKAPDLF